MEHLKEIEQIGISFGVDNINPEKFIAKSEEEKAAALARIRDLEQKSGKQAHVAVEPFKSFWPAEEEHQDFDLKNPEALEKELIESGRKESRRD